MIIIVDFIFLDAPHFYALVSNFEFRSTMYLNYKEQTGPCWILILIWFDPHLRARVNYMPLLRQHLCNGLLGFPFLQEGAHTIPGPVRMLNIAPSNTLRQFHPWPRIIPHNPVLVISTLVVTVPDSKGWAPFPSACPPPSWCSSLWPPNYFLFSPNFHSYSH